MESIPIRKDGFLKFSNDQCSMSQDSLRHMQTKTVWLAIAVAGDDGEPDFNAPYPPSQKKCA